MLIKLDKKLMPHFKFFLAVTFLLLWVISTYLSMIFLITNYNDILQLENIHYHNWAFFQYNITLNKNSYYLFIWIIYTIGLLSSLLLFYSIISRNWIRQELSFLKIEFYYILQQAFRLINQLTNTEKFIAASVLTLIIIVRIYYLQQFFFTTDEVASFDFFVMEGPLAVISFYPIPNNHILSNLLSLIYYQIYTEPLLVMRVPTFAISLVGTIIIYVILIKYCDLAVATLSIGIFCFSQMGIFYAIAGRGYILLTVLSFTSFISMLGIMYKPIKQKLYWFLFIISSILGFYTIPTFLYSFSSIVLIGFCYFLLKNKMGEFAKIVAGSFIIFLGSIALYLPVIVISGINSLINNEYIQSLDSKSFWSGFLPFFYYTEGILIGQERLGKYIFCIVLLISGVKLYYSKERVKVFKIVLPAISMVLIPYFLIIVQRVYPPERVLFYKSVYFCIAIGLIFIWGLKILQITIGYKLLLVVIILVVYSSYQVYHLQKTLVPAQSAEYQRIQTFRWLKIFNPKNVLVLDPYYSLYLNHYFKVAEIACRIHTGKQENVKYDFLIVPKTQQVQDSFDAGLSKEAYENDSIRIFYLIKKE